MFEMRSEEGTAMARVRVGRRDATTVGRLLKEIGQGHDLPVDLTRNAGQWFSAIEGTMDRSDVEQVAVLLRRASNEHRLSRRYRDAARYWAAYLEGRVW